MRAGAALRQAAQQDTARCPSCAHLDRLHRELPFGSDGYAPAVFHCSECACVQDLSIAMRPTKWERGL